MYLAFHLQLLEAAGWSLRLKNDRWGPRVPWPTGAELGPEFGWGY